MVRKMKIFADLKWPIFPHRERYRQKHTVSDIVPMVERSGANVRGSEVARKMKSFTDLE